MAGLDLDSRVDALVNDSVNWVYGRPVMWHPVDAADIALVAIFDDAWVSIKESEGVPISDVGPALLVQLSQFPPTVPPNQGDTVTVLDTLYNVSDINQDGFGCARVILMLAV